MGAMYTCSRCSSKAPAVRTKLKLPLDWVRVVADRVVDVDGRRIHRRCAVILCLDCQTPSLLKEMSDSNPMRWLRAYPSETMPGFVVGSGHVVHTTPDGEHYSHPAEESRACLLCARKARGIEEVPGEPSALANAKVLLIAVPPPDDEEPEGEPA